MKDRVLALPCADKSPLGDQPNNRPKLGLKFFHEGRQVEIGVEVYVPLIGDISNLRSVGIECLQSGLNFAIQFLLHCDEGSDIYGEQFG